jgi:hypothetical protein
MIQLLRRKPALLLCGLLAFLQFFVLGGAFGQNGTLSGNLYRENTGNSVYDPLQTSNANGAFDNPIGSGKTITITGPGGPFTATANVNGSYTIGLAPGTYTVTAPASTDGGSAQSPVSAQYTNVVITSNTTTTRNFGYGQPADTYNIPVDGSNSENAQQCAVPGKDGITASGIVNTYYAPLSNGSVAATSTTLSLNFAGARGAAATLTAGDLLLVMQMQGASFDISNTNLYGDGTGPDAAPYNDNRAPARGYTGTPIAGTYEYITVASISGNTVTLTAGLKNAYNQADATASNGRQSYQVIRVPQYASLSIDRSAPLYPVSWNGFTGGVFAIDVAGTVTFTGAGITPHIDTSGRGFRGGGAVVRSQNNGSVVYRGTNNTGAGNTGATKGEGIAGTPRHLRTPRADTPVAELLASVTVTDSLVATGTTDGYPNGDLGRGAPGNAGGGGDQHNSAGGGGGNGGIGGFGGVTFNGDGGRDVGGNGGGVVALNARKIVLGGGGGAGELNNAAVPRATGGTGGGIIMLRAQTISGSGLLQSDGSNGLGSRAAETDEPGSGENSRDAAGGGGAGGSVLVIASTGHGNISVNARGGRGGNTNRPNDNEYEGPGGGGGGGVVLSNAAVGTTTLTAGVSGLSFSQSFGGTGVKMGATDGQNGQTLTFSNTVPAVVYAGYNCLPTLTVIKANEPSNALVSYSQGVANTNQYKITISNGSGGSAQSVQVTDILPTGFTLAGSPAPTAVLAGGATGTLATAGTTTVVFSGFTIPNGGSVTITYTVNIAASVAIGTYSNPAQVEFLDPTRTSAGYLVKPATNASGGNTSYSGGGTVLGSNYNTALTNEDVRLFAAQISGFVYGDSNHDAIKNGAETGSATDFTGLFVKLVPTAGPNAIAAVAVDPATGAYTFTGMAIGSYNLVLDNNNTLTDTTPSKPANYLGNEAPSQIILAVSVVSNSDNLTNQNFGLYKGSRVTGRVWRDDGNGATAANNGLQLGTEPGLGNFTVSVLSGVSVIDTSTTVGNGDYVLYVPFSTANPLIQVTKPSGWTATGTNIADANVCLVANSSSASQRFVGDTTCVGAASFSSGTPYSGYNLGLVPPIALAANSNQSAGTPSGVSYPHNFTPGTLGNVSFSVTGTQPGFGYALYLDSNNNSVVDGADQSLSSPLTVDNTWPRNVDGTLATRRVILVVNIPSGVATGTVDMATIVASQSFANNLPVLRSASVLDTTTITGSNGNNGILRLIKSSRNCGNITDLAVCSGAYSLNIIQAKPGEVVEYKIEYSNIGSGSISSVVVFDNPPYFSDVIAGFKFWTRPNGSAGNVGNISISISTGLKLELNKPGFDLINPLLPGEAGYVLYRVRVR